MDSNSQTKTANPWAALSGSLAGTVERLAPSTVAVLGRRGHGIASGLIWRDGVLVTAAHVFRRTPAAISIVGEQGREVDAALIGLDSSTDIATFRLPEGWPAPAAIGDSASVRAGELVMVVGRASSGEPTASFGLVNRVSGPWQSWLGGQLDRLIRLDGGVYEGLSGAPVANAQGEVVGIATAALSRTYGIVVPASTVSRVVDALLTKGRVSRAFLGIGGQAVPLPAGPADDGAAMQAGTGLLVTGLVADGPAARAGLMIGDILIDVGGRPAAALHELRASLAGHVGQQVRVRLMRGGQPMELELTLAEWPAQQRRCG